MVTAPRVIVLWKNGIHPYYVANRCLAAWFHIVSEVTGDKNPVHPISEGQLAEIHRRAMEESVTVKVIEGHDLEKIRDFAALGECELPPYWYW